VDFVPNLIGNNPAENCNHFIGARNEGEANQLMAERCSLSECSAAFPAASIPEIKWKKTKRN
jgi:hypothetical protein